MTWSPPDRTQIKVFADAGGDGWQYAGPNADGVGDYHRTKHLTNALHDAGWWVHRARGKKVLP